MSDRWWGHICMEGAPESWFSVTKRTTTVDGVVTGEAEEIDLNLDSPAMPKAVREALLEAGFDGSSSMIGGTTAEPSRNEDGTITCDLADDQLSGGSWRYLEDGLADALKEAGVPFSGGDDGDYGNPGIQFWWRPGLEAIETRTATAEGSIALEIHDLRRMWTAAEDESGYSEPAVFKEKLRAALCEHFDVEDLRLEEEATAGLHRVGAADRRVHRKGGGS